MTIEERLSLCERISAAAALGEVERAERRIEIILQCLGEERKARIEARTSCWTVEQIREAIQEDAKKKGQRTAWEVLDLYGMPDVTRMGEKQLKRLCDALAAEREAIKASREKMEAQKNLRAATRAHEAARAAARAARNSAK